MMIERENKTKREDEQGVRCGGWSRKWTRRPGGAGAIHADYGFRKITFNNEAGLPRGVVGSERLYITKKQGCACLFSPTSRLFSRGEMKTKRIKRPLRAR